MDFQSAMETFAEAWVAANTQTPLTEAAEAQGILLGQASLGSGSSNTTLHELTVASSATPESSSAAAAAGSGTSGGGGRGSSAGRDAPTSSSASGGGDEDPRPAAACIRSSPVLCGAAASVVAGNASAAALAAAAADFRTAPNSKTPNLSSKSIPVHCVVEQSGGQTHGSPSQQGGCPQGTEPSVELDSYAIVPSSTLFSDLVRTALIRLGYSSSEVIGAKGAIQIKNWRPLTFDQITDSSEATVGDILGELTTVATLRIRLYRSLTEPTEWTDTAVRSAVLELLREMSQSKLAKLSPLSQPLISSIVNNKYNGKIGREKCTEFGGWYNKYRIENPGGSAPFLSEKPQDGRLTFHPTKELPQMRDWYRANRNPSNRTLQTYVDIINQGAVRQQERPKVTLLTLKTWWKNERQREKRTHGDHRPRESAFERLNKKRKIEFPIPIRVDEESLEIRHHSHFDFGSKHPAELINI